jgi:transcriptional regulator with XRE-family HTH domain
MCCGLVRAEPDEPTRLGVWLAQRMHKQGLSVRAVEALSGGRVSKSVISALTTGRHRGSRISTEAVEGLAEVFGTTPGKISEMLDQRNPGTEYVPPWEARWLTKEQRAAVDAVIIAFFREG